jgi:hypothetical protein
MTKPIIGGLYRRNGNHNEIACLYINYTNNVDVEFLYPGETFLCLSWDTLLKDGRVWYLQYMQEVFWSRADLVSLPD